MTKTPNPFEKLVAEIGDMHKALPADGADTAAGDKKIEAAAAEGAEASEGEDEGAEGADVVKSYEITLEDGTKVAAVDGTAMLKALGERLEANEATFTTVLTQVFDIVKSQAAQIKVLSAKPAGRKAVLTIAEPAPAAGADLNKSEVKMDSKDFMAKSMELFSAGKLTARDVNVAETCLNNGREIPENIRRVVMAS